MPLEILQPGLLSTIQDAGRYGYRSRGINPGGVMDTFAMSVANALVGNPENEAVLEMHFPAPKIRFTESAIIALTGADFSPHIDDTPVMRYRPQWVAAGSVLSFEGAKQGTRAYLSVHGGWDLPLWLGSRSTHLQAAVGGYKGRALMKQDVLHLKMTLGELTLGEQQRSLPWSVKPALIHKTYQHESVRVLPGPEWDWITDKARRVIETESFTITPASNRTGYRLHGPVLEKQISQEMLSGALAFGTIELLPSGQLVILMADHPVTGGYPRIANVISADLPYLAQLGPAQQLRFQMVNQEEAEVAGKSLRSRLGELHASCAPRFEQWNKH
jgi:antagonist of KipI